MKHMFAKHLPGHEPHDDDVGPIFRERGSALILSLSFLVEV